MAGSPPMVITGRFGSGVAGGRPPLTRGGFTRPNPLPNRTMVSPGCAGVASPATNSEGGPSRQAPLYFAAQVGTAWMAAGYRGPVKLKVKIPSEFCTNVAVEVATPFGVVTF